MIKYKTSDLFKRAKQLADLEGSDFISWNEAINCINESYVGLFEKLINMGDNSYVESFRTGDKEIELPSNFWQLKGVYLWNNGNLQTINRRSDNSGIHHLSYELRNGKIYLFGNPNEVLIEYFPLPMTLTFKPNDVTIDIPEAEYLDCYKHTFLYKSETEEQTETVSIIDLDGYRTVKDFLTIPHDEIVSGWITDTYAAVLDTSGYLHIYCLATGYSAVMDDAVPLITESGTFYIVTNGYVCSLNIGAESYEAIQVVELTEIDTDGDFYISNDDLTDFFYIRSGTIYHNDLMLGKGEKIIYHKGECYYLSAYSFGKITKDDENKTIDNAPGIAIGFIGIEERTGFGYAVKRFNSFVARPYCEDTELNFPNTFYYQILSYLLAISFRCKQGADITLLSSQLEMAMQTFEDTLGSDAYQFPRMGNVYN